LQRPNVIGARAIGLGGAFTAVADDPTAVWHNPAGTAFAGDTAVYIGGELIFLGRQYSPAPGSPLANAGVTTQTLQENTAPTFVPVIGATTRFGFGKTKPTRFALSVLAYDAYGGSISYDPKDVTVPGTTNPFGLTKTQILNFELAPALAY